MLSAISLSAISRGNLPKSVALWGFSVCLSCQGLYCTSRFFVLTVVLFFLISNAQVSLLPSRWQGLGSVADINTLRLVTVCSLTSALSRSLSPGQDEIRLPTMPSSVGKNELVNCKIIPQHNCSPGIFSGNMYRQGMKAGLFHYIYAVSFSLSKQHSLVVRESQAVCTCVLHITKHSKNPRSPLSLELSILV